LDLTSAASDKGCKNEARGKGGVEAGLFSQSGGKWIKGSEGERRDEGHGLNNSHYWGSVGKREGKGGADRGGRINARKENLKILHLQLF